MTAAAVRRVPGWTRRLAALALGTAAALGIGEVAVRLVNRLRTGGAGGLADYGAPFTRPHARLGWELIPEAVVPHRSTEFAVTIRVGASGLRQAAPPAREGRTGIRRVIVLGDSFAFGHGVEEEQRCDAVLASLRADLECVNLGLPGSGTDQQVLLFEERGRDWHPDVVVLLYFVENVRRNATSLQQGRAKPRFELDESGALRLVAAPADSRPPAAARAAPFSFHSWLKRESALYGLAHAALADPLRALLRSRFPDPYPEYTADGPAWRVTRALFRRLRDDARAGDATLLVAFVPERRHLFEDWPHASIVVEACEAAGIEALDLTPALRAAAQEGEPTYYRRDGHWTPEGHRAVGKALAERIRE